MADRSIVVRLRAEISDYKRKLNEASDAARRLGDEQNGYVQKNKDSINELSTSVGVVGAAMTAVAGLAVAKFVQFDKSMSAVAAATHESAANMELLRDAALDAGKRTVFSADESASAIEELAKAGISTADILGGALNGSLDLAAAGAMDVAEAAGYTSVALAQFKLDGGQAAHVADLLAAGAGKALGEVSDLGMALRQGGQVAAQTGLTVEETTAALAAFAKAGLLGSDAGTSFKSMLQRLTPQSEESADLMQNLGISAYDAQGQFIGLASFAGNLQSALRDLTPEQRNSALATIFGSDAVRAASVIYEQGEDGIRSWISAVDDQGYAAETAATRLDNLAGDWEQLSGSVETALIGMGEGANGPLRELTQGATDVVNAFSGLPSGVQQGTLAIVGGSGLVLLGLAGLGKLTVGISNAKNAFENLGVSAKTAGTLAGAIGGALAVATIAISAWASANAEAEASIKSIRDSLDETTGAITDNTREIIANELTVQHGWGIFKKESAADAARTLQVSLGDVTDAIMGNADALQRVHDVTRVTGRDAIGLADELGISVSDLTIAQGTLETEISDYTERLPEAQAEQRSLTEGITGTVGAMSAAEEQARMVSGAQDRMKGATQDATGAAQEQTDALGDLIDAQRDLAGYALSDEEAQIRFQAAIDDVTQSLWDSAGVTDEMIDKNGALTSVGQGLVDALVATGGALDVTTEKGRANRSALLDLADASWAQIEAAKQHGASENELVDKMEASRQAFLDAAEAAGMTTEEAKALADELNLVPASVTTTFVVDDSQVRAMLDMLAKPIYARVAGVNSQGGALGRADGGPIVGPGTETSDSILARLSTQEHVWSAREVRGAGGHGEVARMRALARTGNLPKFFDGGTPARYAMPVNPGGVSSGIDYDRLARAMRSQGGPSLTVGTMVTADAGAAVREMNHELAMSWAGVR